MAFRFRVSTPLATVVIAFPMIAKVAPAIESLMQSMDCSRFESPQLIPNESFTGWQEVRAPEADSGI